MPNNLYYVNNTINIMTTLIKYHTIQANPDHYWENNAVAAELSTA